MTEEDASVLAQLTEHDVRRLIQGQNRWYVAGLVLIIVMVGFTAWLAGGGRAASRDNLNATSVSLANNGRNACITDLRNEQLAAQGAELAALGRALIAGLVADNPTEVQHQVSLFEAAATRQDAAAKASRPEQLNADPADGGCGPPITDVNQLP